MRTKGKIGMAGMFAALACMAGGSAKAASSLYYTFQTRHAAQNSSFVMGEFTGVDGSVGYLFDVASGVSVNVFVVSFVKDPFFNSVFTPNNGWEARIVLKENWASGQYGFSEVSGSALGSFESLFGNVDNAVAVFTAPTTFEGEIAFVHDMTEESDSDSATWEGGFAAESDIPFRRTGGTATDVIAINQSGALLGGSLIPEPSSASLIAMATIGLLARRRR